MFVILFLVSAGVSCVLYKKIGLLWSLAILLALPLVLFIIDNNLVDSRWRSVRNGEYRSQRIAYSHRE